MSRSSLAILGGEPTWSGTWPQWPRASHWARSALGEALDSTRWTVSGPFDGRVAYERRFAGEYAAWHDVSHCTPVSSGTAALTVALQGLGVGRGDEVLVPGLTWVACASAVTNLGAFPVLVDCTPGSLTMSPSAARAAVTTRTRAVMVVHPYNNVVDLDEFTAWTRAAGLPLIEDCAQAHGARWRGQQVGTFGAAGCFSFQQSKLVASGEGGAVITADADLYDRFEQLRLDGRRFADRPALGRLELVEVGGIQGRNFGMSELHAVLALDGLHRLECENAIRARSAELLESSLESVIGVDVVRADERVTRRTYYNQVLRFDPQAFCDASIDVIARAVTAELGTPVNPVYTPLNRHRLFVPDRVPSGNLTTRELRRLNYATFELPNAERARRSCATLTHPVLLSGEAELLVIAEALTKVQANAGDLLGLPQAPSADAF